MSKRIGNEGLNGRVSHFFKVLFHCYQMLLEAQGFPSLLSASPPCLTPNFPFVSSVFLLTGLKSRRGGERQREIHEN